ncbi:acyltransferase [Sphingomonas sp. PB1R3]|uniref:acyltransferase n=1 Tax=Sphingomonas flavida TaxID=3096154 RepID=UPI002FC5C13D
MLRHLVNLLLWALPPTRLFALRRMLLRLGGLDLGENVSICGQGWFFGPGAVRIGAGTWLSPRVLIYTHAAAPVVIGPSCDIGPFVRILTGGHEIGNADRRAGPGTARAVSIGAGCWIGANTLILGGSSIGEGTIVAAGSVVIGDLPPNCLAAGVPARIKRMLDE